jgi:flagellar biosynthesis/type III secretory pathway protein FliH
VWAELREPNQEEEERARDAEAKAAADAVVRHRRELEEAYHRGLAEGEESGELRARSELVTAVRTAHAVLERLTDVEESFQASLKENLAALSVAVARTILDREFSLEPEALADSVRGALAVFPLDQSLKIRINPEDLSRISVASGEALPITAGREVRWIPDEAIAHGGCVVEGPDRVVDGRIDRALERVYWALRDA